MLQYSGTLKSYEVRIYNIQGNLVNSFKNNNRKFDEINIENYPDGLYLFSVSSEGHYSVYKINKIK